MDKIICIGKNYFDHAKEMGDSVPEKPVIFIKPPSVLKQVSAWEETITLSIPEEQSFIDYECEIVFRLKQDAYQVPAIKNIEQCIDAVSIGLDMTIRSLQDRLKKAGHPWTIAKVFKDAAVIGPWLDWNTYNKIKDENFSLAINGTTKQEANVKQMRMSINDLLIYISHFFPLYAGDIIYTGTPAGVGPVKRQDEAQIEWAMYHYFVMWN